MKRITEVERCSDKVCPYHKITNLYLGKPIRVCYEPQACFGYLACQEFKDGFPVKCPLKKCEIVTDCYKCDNGETE
jgi:hypothetical protein